MITGKKSLFFNCRNLGSFLVAGFSVFFSVSERVHGSWKQYPNHFTFLSLIPGGILGSSSPASWTPTHILLPLLGWGGGHGLRNLGWRWQRGSERVKRKGMGKEERED